MNDLDLLLGPFDFIMEHCREWGYVDLVSELTFEQKREWLRRKISEETAMFSTKNNVRVRTSRISILADSFCTISQCTY